MRILVVDDEPIARKAIERTLRHLGHDVVAEAATGAEALRRVIEQRPDLVTLDLGLPGGGAQQVAETIADKHCIPVVVVSGSADIEQAGELARRGIGAVVWKPFQPQDLAAAVAVAAARQTDIRDLRRHGDEVQRERVRLLQLFDASVDGIYIVRADGVMSMVNGAALRLLGMSQDGMRGRTIESWLTDFRARGATSQPFTLEELPLARALQGETVRGFEIWIDALDGAERCLSMSASPVHGVDGALQEAVCLLRDVTADRETEREVARRTERRRRELTRLSQELLAASSPNDMAQRCVVRVREALGAERVRMITIGEDGKSRVVSGETGRGPSSGMTLPPGRKMGISGYALVHAETVWSGDLWAEHRFEIDEGDADDRSAVAAPLMVGDRVLGLLVATSTDPQAFDADDAHLVTLMANQGAMAIENLRMADRIIEQQKMASLGLMSAGIVHEIKNPLSYIQSNVESALELLDKLAEALSGDGQLELDQQRVREDQQALREAHGGCTRIFKIIEGIQSFAHPGRAKREPTDVNRLVEVALTLAHSEMKRWCRVSREFGRLPEVPCDGPKISQVVLNLLINAAQAIQSTGQMGNIQVITRLEGSAAQIIVADDGPGIAPEIMDKIFLPLFTTKPQGQGTGLGLAICRRLMEGQGGTLGVESALGKGTRFTVGLPLHPRSAPR